MFSATNFQEASLERRGVFSAFVLPNVDLKAGAQAAILDDEVSLGMEAMQGGGITVAFSWTWREPPTSPRHWKPVGMFGWSK